MSDINIINSQANMQVDNEQNFTAIQKTMKEPNPGTKRDKVDISQDYRPAKKVQFSSKKLKINSRALGSETVSNDIVNFVKNIFENYKATNVGDEDATTLHTFYIMAKNSIASAYKSASDNLEDLPSEVSTLSKDTVDRSIEKLDTWFRSQIKPKVKRNVNTDNSQKFETKKSSIPQKNIFEISEEIQEAIQEILKKQNLAAKEDISKKPNYDFKG